MQRKFNIQKEFEYSSVQKAITILLSFIPDNRPMRTLELSRVLGINKSTVSRLIQVLMHFGLVQQDEAGKGYMLGQTSALLGLAVEKSQNDRLVEWSRIHMEQLRDSVGESVCLEAFCEGRNQVLAEAVGPPPLSVRFVKFPEMNVTAGSKAMLAFAGPELPEKMARMKTGISEGKSVADFAVLTKQLSEIRMKAIAYDHGEANADVHAVSVPIFNCRGAAVASLSICVPSFRENKILSRMTVAQLRKKARIISEILCKNRPWQALSGNARMALGGQFFRAADPPGNICDGF